MLQKNLVRSSRKNFLFKKSKFNNYAFNRYLIESEEEEVKKNSLSYRNWGLQIKVRLEQI